ncbi:thymidine kinase [Mycoplasma sp. ES3157-GEN-MYC]|uniref:Thymidine kinase n=1 Tax=Mycoplasma miroungigenitalium TaxID=754515 RepID=A0A6M4JFX0_9MOLU|nr:thymidine kinase [Mycoplasma miroungigenitalium]MBU4690496.1 thymidine kinase [Mycoplasma miroungigenitalium]MBU4691763.1 thymidine kinase [Mycoplasma miroungigenitalium]QJR43591.1 thymidine kinase [Mycoplasma miroungigenitalium]
MNRGNIKGWLEVITGPMFSGKTEELLKRVNTLKWAEVNTLVIKPSFDSRFSDSELVSRTGAKLKSQNVKNSKEILEIWSPEYRAVAIDEMNFFDENLPEVIEYLLSRDVNVLVSGLDLDFLRKPFGITPHIIAIADEVSKLKAVCVVCKRPAGFSFRKISNQDLNVLGDSEYEARCRQCHIKGEKEKAKNNK